MSNERTVNERAFERWQAFCESAWGPALMFAWAFAEAIVWPVIPDSVLLPLVAGGRRNFRRIVGASVGGSALGVAVMYLFAYFVPGAIEPLLGWLPMVRDFMIERVNRNLDEYGIAAFLVQPWGGVSYKVYALLGAARGFNPWLVIPFAIVARSARMLLNALVIAGLVRRFEWFVRRAWLYLFVSYALIFGAIWWRSITCAACYLSD